MLVARAFLAMTCAAALLATAPRTFTVDEVEALEAEQRAAEAQLAAITTARIATSDDLAVLEAQLISAAMESRRREEEASRAELALIDLRTRMISTRDSLLEDRAALEEVLGIMATARRTPPPALIVSPDRANEAVRRAIVTGDAAPRLAERVETLAGEIERLNGLEMGIRRERARLETAEAVLALKEQEILQLTTAKRVAFETVTVDAEALRRRVADLGAQAASLRDLLADLEVSAPGLPGRKPALRPQFAAATPGDLPGPSAGAARPRALAALGQSSLGQLGRPVSGLVVTGYGERLPGGGTSEGIHVEARPGAQVLAPADGRIEYAGKFRSYGEMLILRTSDGYHVILSGMGQIYGSVGQVVRAGEPVGQMGRRSTPPPELYLELRQGDVSLNPARWMRGG
ncbi:MAG: peptidoglycan DD-metalloendopeptidase family protein [Pseudomonadota bacterium]